MIGEVEYLSIKSLWIQKLYLTLTDCQPLIWEIPEVSIMSQNILFCNHVREVES